jgi:hypothetical protein
MSSVISEINLLSNERDEFSASRSLARPDRFSPANSFASTGSDFKGFPGPHRFSKIKVALSSDDPDFGLREHPGQEGVFCRQTLGEFLAKRSLLFALDAATATSSREAVPLS